MTLTLILVAIFCITAASARTLMLKATQQLDEEWAMFKNTYGKSYASAAEENMRRKVWAQNLLRIQRHNVEADLGRHSFHMGINDFSDLTDGEFRQQRLRLQLNATRKRSGATFLPPSNALLPQTVDWRTEGYVTPVKNQGACGSCYAFSATGSLEGQHFRKTGRLVSLSEQQIVDCDYDDYGCNGGYVDDVFDYIAENSGIDTETSYPYTGKRGDCLFNPNKVGATVFNFHDIPRGNEMDLQLAVATVGPVSVAIDSDYVAFRNYKHGVYDNTDCSTDLLDHYVLVVGYGTEDGKDYWLVKNSWGTSWGMNGYIKMARNKDNQCGIATMASYPLLESD